MLDTTWKLVPVVSLGIFLRYSFRFSTYFTEISKRVEVSSPVSAWIRGIYWMLFLLETFLLIFFC